MIEKLFYTTQLKNTFSDIMEVTFGDGEKVQQGEGAPKFSLIFHDVIPKAELMQNASVAFGEAYMNGIIEIEGSIKEVIASIYNKQESFLTQLTLKKRAQQMHGLISIFSREDMFHLSVNL